MNIIMTWEQAVLNLKEGNARFIKGTLAHARCDASALEARRKALVSGQVPYAAILTCSDARVSPEYIFDAGLGDLFVVRVAGNVGSMDVVASVEYAAAHLNVPLVIVLGHSACGAVNATLCGAKEGHLDEISCHIRPCVSKACELCGAQSDDQLRDGQNLARVGEVAARLHAQHEAAVLSESEPVLKPLVQKSVLKIMPTYYDLESGRVEWLPSSSGLCLP